MHVVNAYKSIDRIQGCLNKLDIFQLLMEAAETQVFKYVMNFNMVELDILFYLIKRFSFVIFLYYVYIYCIMLYRMYWNMCHNLCLTYYFLLIV